MKRSLIAAALAAALLPAASFTAEAASGVYNPWVRGAGYGLACTTNDSKYVIPKFGIELKNPSSITVPKNTKVEMKIWTKSGFVQQTIYTPREMAPGQTVRVAQPSGAFRCLADARVYRIDKSILTRR